MLNVLAPFFVFDKLNMSGKHPSDLKEASAAVLPLVVMDGGVASSVEGSIPVFEYKSAVSIWPSHCYYV